MLGDEVMHLAGHQGGHVPIGVGFEIEDGVAQRGILHSEVLVQISAKEVAQCGVLGGQDSHEDLILVGDRRSKLPIDLL
jgi:hypothetical protein